MQLNHDLIAFCLIATTVFSACAVPQEKVPGETTTANIKLPPPVIGETVVDIDPSYGDVFQDKDHNYWFSGGNLGVYRYDGKTVSRFTTKDGLPSDHVGGIQQHAPTGDIILITSNGFSRFDGRAFTTLSVADASKSEWKLQPDDLWFPAGQDTGAVYRYDGGIMHRLTFPKTQAGDDATLPRDKYPNAKYSPYDVYTIYRDSRGHVWFGTAILGACRYDGKSFAWFAKPAEDLGSFGTRSIIEDKEGKFWFSSTLNRHAIDAAPALADERGDVAIKFHTEPGVGNEEDAFSVFMSAVTDKNGDLWVATLGAGVFRYDGTKMTQYPVAFEEEMMFGISIYKDRQDNLWLGSQKDGVYKFNGKTFERFRPGDQDAVVAKGEIVTDIGNSCWYVFQDKNNNYWFGTDGNGVCRFDGKTINRFTTRDGLAHDQVRGIQQHASTGDILITTNAGVSKFDGQRLVTLPITEMKSAAPPNEGWTLNPDDLWMTGAGGPRRYDGKTLYQLKFPKSPLEDELSSRYGHSAKNWSSYDVWTVYKDRKGHVWFGTAMFGICRFDGQSHDWMFEGHLTEVPGAGWFGFRSIIEDRNGDFWFCNTQHRYKIEPHGVAGQEAGKLKYTREKGIDLAGSATTDKFFYYQSIIEDNNRDLWMAPYAGGVWKYDGKNVTHYPMKIGDEEITMFTIYKDNRGDLWVGSHEHGAWKFNGTTFERFKP